METYKQMKDRQQAEFDEFSKAHMFYAYDQEQFNEGMRSIGLDPTETDKIYRGVAGSYYRKTDSKALSDLMERFEQEKQSAVDADEDGSGFVEQMFEYEMWNHEYGYTGDPYETLVAAGYTVDEVEASDKLLHGWKLAEKAVQDWYREQEEGDD